MNTTDAAFVAWVREHSRISPYTLRRRFRVSRAEAEAGIAELVEAGHLAAEAEGISHEVVR